MQVHWPALVKEARAVPEAVQHFQVFIKGCPIELRCDHKPLARFLEAQTKNEMVNYWSLIIQEFDITFKWVCSEENISDCLSCLVKDKLFISHPENSKFNDFPEKSLNLELSGYEMNSLSSTKQLRQSLMFSSEHTHLKVMSNSCIINDQWFTISFLV